MGIHAFYLYQVGWYLFGTFAAFAAALLFWQKGRAVVSGREQGSGFKLRLTGAAGIFVSVLLVIHFINPLTPLTDYSKLLLVYSTVEANTEGGEFVHYILQPSQFDRELITSHPLQRSYPSLFPNILLRPYPVTWPFAAQSPIRES